jgi:hypothetical protein
VQENAIIARDVSIFFEIFFARETALADSSESRGASNERFRGRAEKWVAYCKKTAFLP